MFSSKDLNGISKIFNESLDSKLESKFTDKLSPIAKSISSLRKDVRKIKNNLDILISRFKRLEKIELKTGISNISI